MQQFWNSRFQPPCYSAFQPSPPWIVPPHLPCLRMDAAVVSNACVPDVWSIAGRSTQQATIRTARMAHALHVLTTKVVLRFSCPLRSFPTMPFWFPPTDWTPSLLRLGHRLTVRLKHPPDQRLFLVESVPRVLLGYDVAFQAFTNLTRRNHGVRAIVVLGGPFLFSRRLCVPISIYVIQSTMPTT
jgi:hypothetical protein